MDVNEYGKRWVSWDGVKGGEKTGKWVARESNAQNKKVGLGPSDEKAQGSLLGSKNFVLGLGLSSPSSLEAGESSFTGPTILDPSYQNYLYVSSSGMSELTTSKKHESSMVLPTPSMKPVMLHHDLLLNSDGSGRQG